MIRQTFDMDAVNHILTHPDIWKDIAPADQLPFDTPYLPHVMYFLVNNGDGVVMTYRFRDGCKIHPNILPDKRGKLAYWAVDEVIEEMFSSGVKVIYAEIDRKFVHVIRFAKALGFSLLESNERDLLVRYKLNS